MQIFSSNLQPQRVARYDTHLNPRASTEVIVSGQRRRERIVKGLRVPVAVLVAVFAASAQQPAQPAADNPKVTIALGDVTAPPEWQLKVPFSIAIAEGTEVARVSARITYPPKILRFDRVE